MYFYSWNLFSIGQPGLLNPFYKFSECYGHWLPDWLPVRLLPPVKHNLTIDKAMEVILMYVQYSTVADKKVPVPFA